MGIIFPIVLFSFKRNKTNLICKKWEYVNSRTSYLDDIDYIAKPDHKKYLIFDRNGTFEEIDPWNCVKGKWKFNNNLKKIRIAYINRNGKKTKSSELFNLDRNITSITEKELKFWIQGRHRYVSYTYKAVD